MDYFREKEKEKEEFRKNVVQIIGALLVLFVAPLFLMLGLNKIFYEFNLPTFNYWIYFFVTSGLRTIFK